tara:strand:+ start:1967 stop:2218 length:252 start_codon:yes stop_codon:yes gene_type:complete
MMHPPVRPVEISVVKPNHEDQTQKKVDPAVFLNVTIDMKVSVFIAQMHPQTDGCEYEYGAHRVSKLKPEPGGPWPPGLNKPMC